MNYYNEIKNELINNDINQDKTIGIIICKKDNRFIMQYCSDEGIYNTFYLLN